MLAYDMSAPSTAMKVLIADDDPVFRRLLESLLAKWGYESVSAHNGSEAWELVRHDEEIGVAVIDWILPGVDGLELCRRFKEELRYRGLYAILVTAHHEEDDCVLALESGADDFVAKPINPPELLARIRAGARIVAYQQQLYSLALEDSLTGLGNRRAYLNDLKRTASFATRNEYSFGLLLLDIAGFHQLNEQYGHAAGDRMLRLVTRALRGCYRAEDTIYRIGSDEFAIIFPGISDVESIPVNRFLENLAAECASAVGEDVALPHQLAVRFGRACHTPDYPYSADELERIAAADLAGQSALAADSNPAPSPAL